MISYTVTDDTVLSLVSLTEAKAQLRVTHTNEDTVIQGYISTAIIMAEDYLCRSIHLRNVEAITNRFINNLRLERTPINGDVVIKYYNENNELQTLNADTYLIRNNSGEPEIHFTDESTLPLVYDRIDAVKITYNIGYTDSVDVPVTIKQFVLLKITQMYENRTDTVQRYSTFGESLLRPYRKWQY